METVRSTIIPSSQGIGTVTPAKTVSERNILTSSCLRNFCKISFYRRVRKCRISRNPAKLIPETHRMPGIGPRSANGLRSGSSIQAPNSLTTGRD